MENGEDAHMGTGKRVKLQTDENENGNETKASYCSWECTCLSPSLRHLYGNVIERVLNIFWCKVQDESYKKRRSDLFHLKYT